MEKDFVLATYIETGDWAALYLNGKLEYQGTSLHLASYLQNKLVYLEMRSYVDVDDKYLEACGAFPDYFADLIAFGESEEYTPSRYYSADDTEELLREVREMNL